MSPPYQYHITQSYHITNHSTSLTHSHNSVGGQSGRTRSEARRLPAKFNIRWIFAEIALNKSGVRYAFHPKKSTE
ncbi:hypothetical protein AAMO2058_000186800 [Amorphochlora amoebiformis]